MNLLRQTLLLTSAMILLLSPSRTARAAIFTSDTTIGVNNTNFDGQDLVVINCTVTVDGPHAFSDVLVIDNGTLTHSFATNGLLANPLQVVDELQTLTGTNFSTLDEPNVEPPTVVVTGLTNGVTYVAGTDYVLSPGTNGTTQIARVATSTIPDGATVAVSYVYLGPPLNTGLNLVVSNNVVIEAGSAIDADGRGFGGLNGPGAGAYVTNTSPYYSFSGSGGGYAGYGGSSLGGALGGTAYGSLMNPTNTGSGGGGGSGAGAGGGAVHLVVGGALQVDGQITANGDTGSSLGSGGGAGGGILLSATSFGGAGSISANGGAGEPGSGGGGGGGRVAVYFTDNEFTGTISAHGGAGFVAGGAGTIYTHPPTYPFGQLVIDNGGLSGTNTPFNLSVPVDFIITNGAVAVTTGNFVPVHNLLIASNSALTALPILGLDVNVSGDATVQPGGAILVDRLGYVSGGGPGAGGSISVDGFSSGGGGGHGGDGAVSAFGAVGGGAYDSPLTPSQGGSGGGSGNGTAPYNLGGPGGGILNLNVSGHLFLGGLISANGGTGVGEGSGGGGGGSVLVQTDGLLGSGTVSACGSAGQAADDGGGGGGCIAVYSVFSSFTGNLVATGGGSGTNRGGAGTIYTSLTNGGTAQLVIDNGGARGTNTPAVTSASGYDLTISGGAVAVASNSAPVSVHNLLIGSNSSLAFQPVFPQQPPSMNVTVTGNGTIQVGGSMLLDGKGYAAGLGPGEGGHFSTNGFQVGGGGGHGGVGGNYPGAQNGGGYAYDVVTTPEQPGSGGSSGIGLTGGAGGGALHLTVTGTLLVAGSISANGMPGTGEDCGGGSGGSIWLSAGTLTGAGTIAANGGAGELPLGGGGGGGRIAILVSSNTFTGSLSAYGAVGGVSGGAGTIYLQNSLNLSPASLLVIDNGGLVVTSTTPFLPVSGIFDLMITNGATVSAAVDLPSIRNLVIASGSFLTSSGNVMLQFTAGNATIAPGGGIILDGKGFAGGQGQAPGLSLISNETLTGGGGGHGGSGGVSATGAPGGTNYDSFFQPVEAGSGGGAGSGVEPNNLGGAGGGALSLNVTGTLTLAGSISANGYTGVGQGSGGGAGGSIHLTAGKLTGNGTVSANGGAGESSLGGGGGAGGSISITTTLQPPPPTNPPPFSGSISAHGGLGAVAGGAGTIYTLLSSAQPAQIVLDNGGMLGATTPYPQSQNSDYTVSGGARVLVAIESEPIHKLLVASNSFLSVAPLQGPLAMQITAAAVTIQAGGGIVVDGQGYSQNSGPGDGHLTQSIYGPVGGGGGHGGAGGSGAAGTPGGPAYDSITLPTNPGSGGGGSGATQGAAVVGGTGGGAVGLSVTGALELDGFISANGTVPTFEGSGGGAGGSIQLTVGSLAGAGSISANGGAGSLPYGGGGGGGRIAISASTNIFVGTVSAIGAPGFVDGGAGTIYSSTKTPSVLQVVADNGGLIGTNTPISLPQQVSLVVSGGAQAQLLPVTSPLVLSNLLVGAGSAISQATLDLTVLGNALIDANGRISADGQGPGGPDNDPGRGSFANGSGSGGGYGGAGGPSGSGLPGGLPYGSSLQPTNSGSSGGISSSAPTGLCLGGGAILLQVGGALTVNGMVAANGAAALFEGTGGGSGGSVFLIARTLGGNGAITVDGGAGEPSGGGGGGGGGRMAVFSATNNFTGAMTALGGTGYSMGQTGSIVLSNGPPAMQVISGTITNSRGQPIASVSLQPSGGLPAVVTDVNGNYSLPVSLGWSGSITPSQPGGVFVPGALSYTIVAQAVSGQNYLLVTPSSLAMSYAVQGGNLNLSWFGVGGVNYQVQSSTDLINWLPYGPPIAGANGMTTLTVPRGSQPQMFFRLGVAQPSGGTVRPLPAPKTFSF
jgi:hypothetical protein